MKRTAKTDEVPCFVDGTPLNPEAWERALEKIYGEDSLHHDYELYDGLEEELVTSNCAEPPEKEPELLFDEVTGKIIDEEECEENDE
tara:strand:+ start:651 stop:911 length:261 start_codon:yes stop_codon:yes gene_type:complete